MKRLLATALLVLAADADAATFVVSNTADSGAGSLRQAILDANTNPGLDNIDFSIGTGPQQINIVSSIVATSPVIIDGATQEGFSGTPLIVINGSAMASDALIFAAGADGSEFRRLEIGGTLGAFDTAAIAITGANTVTIAGNVIGGVNVFSRRSRCGIRIHTANNIVGGLTSTDRNVSVNESSEVLLMPTATGNVIQGNYFGLDPTGLIPRFPASVGVSINGASNTVVGGTQPGARNVIITSGNCIQLTNGAANNRVEGNYLGLDATGKAAAPYFPGTSGVTASATGSGNVIGGTTAAARNVISNNDTGVAVDGGVVVEGNYIGTDPSGLTAVPNGRGAGFFAHTGAQPAVIGPNNLISGNAGDGVNATAITTAAHAIVGNFIGVAADGTTPLPNGGNGVTFLNSSKPVSVRSNIISNNGQAGIRLANGTDVTIGGSPAAANTITANAGPGVTLIGAGVRNVIAANSIDVNGGLGIDLGNDGVTPNDAADADNGPNGLQNFPTLIRAVFGGGQTFITGTFSGAPNTTLTIDFYGSPSADPSGFGEGRRYLGATGITTDNAGAATISAVMPGTSAGELVTATATAATTGTSEFSNAVAAAPAGTLQFSSSTYLAAEGTTATITVTRLGGSAGAVSVNYATGGGNATAGTDYTPASGTLMFADGQTSATFTISIASDSADEVFETVQLTLSNATNGATLGSPSQSTLLIADPARIPALGNFALSMLCALLALLALKAMRPA